MPQGVGGFHVGEVSQRLARPVKLHLGQTVTATRFQGQGPVRVVVVHDNVTARRVAEELTEHDAFGAHVDVELGIDPGDLSNPRHAAVSSAIAFTLGAIIPLVAILLPAVRLRVPVAFFAVLVALALTGTVSAILGGARKRRAVLRVVLGGALAMLVTYGVGQLVGTTI